jgi:D-alanyl-D-alanine carboxypeptidase/D-alanyl-D-alanine-endopeptidase (penicillin-binding protein 4)
VTVAVLAVALGAYGTADAADRVPGVLTTDPVPAEAQPFPDVEVPGGELTAPVPPGPDESAPAPTAAALESLTAALESDDRRTGSFGLVVADGITGEVLVDHDGATPRLPASSLKVLTAAAALDALGPARTLTTSVVRPAPDRLVLVGGGDILLAAGEGDPSAVVGHAGLADLAAATAEALTEEGVTTVELAVDDTLFTGPAHHADWDDVDRTFVMPIQPLAIEAGWDGRAYTADPALDAGQAFAAALAGHGVQVAGSVGRGAAGTDAEPLAQVESAPVSAVVRHMLRASDNSVAEALARLVALERGQQPDFPGGTSAVRRQVADLGVDVDGVTMADSSGLSTGSTVPPSVLVDVLRLASEPSSTTLHGLVPALPVGGLDGTLSDRLTGDAAGQVRAKTGTLLRAVSLTGSVVTDDGRPLLFSLLASDLEVGTAHQARLAVDAWASALAACGCS